VDLEDDNPGEDASLLLSRTHLALEGSHHDVSLERETDRGEVEKRGQGKNLYPSQDEVGGGSIEGDLFVWRGDEDHLHGASCGLDDLHHLRAEHKERTQEVRERTEEEGLTSSKGRPKTSLPLTESMTIPLARSP
jgi:hypothetical protein